MRGQTSPFRVFYADDIISQHRLTVSGQPDHFFASTVVHGTVVFVVYIADAKTISSGWCVSTYEALKLTARKCRLGNVFANVPLF